MRPYVKPTQNFMLNIEKTDLEHMKDQELQNYLDRLKQVEQGIVYQTNPDYILRQIGDECVLVPLGSSTIFNGCMLMLNQTCTFLWKCFQTKHTIKEVIEQAQQQFEGPELLIEKEVQEFVEAYVEKELLVEG